MKLKKLLALVLALGMMLSGSVMAFADDEDDESKFHAGDVAVLRGILETNWRRLPESIRSVLEENNWEESEEWLELFGNDKAGENEPLLHVLWNEQGGTEIKRITYLMMCNLNLVGTLNVSSLKYLVGLECPHNELTKLVLPPNPSELLTLECQYNLLKSVADIENLPNGWTDGDGDLVFSPQNEEGFGTADGDEKIINDLRAKLTNKDVLEVGKDSSGRVTTLMFSGGFYTGGRLDLSGLTELTYLDCRENELTELVLSRQSKLEYLFCSDNKLTFLDLSACTSLRQVDCVHNYMTSEDVDITFPEGWFGKCSFSPQNKQEGDDTTGGDGGDGNNGGNGNNNNNESAVEVKKEETADESNLQAEEAAMEVVEAAIEAISEGRTPAKVQTVSTAAGTSVTAVPVSMYGAGAHLSVGSMETMSGAGVALNVKLDGGAAEILIPGGFIMPNDPRRVYYPLGLQQNPYYADLMRDRVKGADAKTEVCCLGAGTLPTSVTVTLKTKLTGTVNVYYWDEATRRVTLLGSGAVQNGKVAFATKQLGNLIITTGEI